MNKETTRLYELKTRMIQAIGQPIRLAIVEFLGDGEQCVCDITRHLGAQRPNVSRHLAVMLSAGVLQCRKDGLKMIYSLRTPCLRKFLACVDQAVRQQIAADSKAIGKR